MKRMMEKGKGKRRTQTKCRANKRRRFAAQSTREAEETKADHRNKVAAYGGSTNATCPWLLLSHAFSAQVYVKEVSFSNFSHEISNFANFDY